MMKSISDAYVKQQKLTIQEVTAYTKVAKIYVSILARGQKIPERDTLIELLLAA